MDLILGGTGDVGSTLIESLSLNRRFRTVIRNRAKADKLIEKGIEVIVADYLDKNNMEAAFKGIHTAFLLTPENIGSADLVEENEKMLDNYKKALTSNEVPKIVGLSSIGAQHSSGTGNLLFSHKLEKIQAPDLKTRIFLRPAYYYSNWMHYLPIIKKQGILPSFFPPELKIPMVSPKKVGQVAAALIEDDTMDSQVIELVGPKMYCANDIARIFSEVLKKKVNVSHIPPEKWEENLRQAGFSPSAAKGVIKMTEAVIEAKAQPEHQPRKTKPTFYQYLKEIIN